MFPVQRKNETDKTDAALGQKTFIL